MIETGHIFSFLSWKSGFHVQVDEALHFFKGIDTVLYLRDAEGEVVGHVGIDGERHFDIVRSGFQQASCLHPEILRIRRSGSAWEEGP